MARFSNYCLIPNLMLYIPNISLYTTTIQDKDTAIVVKLNTKAENAKSQL